MTIAAHISLTGGIFNLQDNFNYRCFSLLATRYPEHQFVFLFDRPVPAGIISAGNVISKHVAPSIKNNLLQYYWYQVRLPAVLKKYHVDFFAGNGPVCITGTNIRQGIEINDLSFLDKRNGYNAREARYLKKRIGKFIDNAAVVAVASRQMAGAVKALNPDAGDKIHITGRGLPGKPLVIEDMVLQQFKTDHTDGKEFFLALINEPGMGNTTALLKAFSIFKKRQLSKMKLVLLVSATYKAEIVPDYKNYKYRDDVIIIKNENNSSGHICMAAAYAAMYFPEYFSREENLLLPLMYAVPLITGSDNLQAGIYDGNALYCQPAAQQVAEKMMLLYKDEDLRNSLAANYRQLATSCTWEQAASNLWASITGSASQTA